MLWRRAGRPESQLEDSDQFSGDRADPLAGKAISKGKLGELSRAYGIPFLLSADLLKPLVRLTTMCRGILGVSAASTSRSEFIVLFSQNVILLSSNYTLSKS